jgi:hypothetical protein
LIFVDPLSAVIYLVCSKKKDCYEMDFPRGCLFAKNPKRQQKLIVAEEIKLLPINLSNMNFII